MSCQRARQGPRIGRHQAKITECKKRAAQNSTGAVITRNGRNEDQRILDKETCAQGQRRRQAADMYPDDRLLSTPHSGVTGRNQANGEDAKNLPTRRAA